MGIRGYPLLQCVPVKRALPPILHLLLGLGNDIYSKFKEYISVRIEKLTKAELEAQNMTLLSEIKIDQCLIAIDDIKSELNELVQRRITINSNLRQRGLTSTEKLVMRNEL